MSNIPIRAIIQDSHGSLRHVTIKPRRYSHFTLDKSKLFSNNDTLHQREKVRTKKRKIDILYSLYLLFKKEYLMFM